MERRIGLTLGDPAGIGAEIILKALSRLSKQERQLLLIIGSRFVLEKVGLNLNKIKYDLVDLDNVKKRNFSFGKTNLDCAKASLEYLDKAHRLIKAGEIYGIVTCPVSKRSINLVRDDFYGQTEYLGGLDSAKIVRMMLLASKLRFSLCTTHIPLKEVSKRLSIENIYKTICLTALELERFFKIKMPKIGICGLNPHLGEAGLLGREEIDFIKPAILKSQKILKNIKVFGPHLLEGIVLKMREGQLDAAICFYHDQAMLPLKLLYQETGINLTLGLSFVRTSPLHGTAFDIAGKDKANPNSLLDAIRLTLRLVANAKDSSKKIPRSEFPY
ncbi:MAG: 4-hydroxythreonine-4-phosphate dehydrogenase PdxA [Candidatus Omnitrophica bacterium]|nr:4-hydroxythreonine-4-phosphate dehydrogenase PdxA [Candidatus Omnitrophota bacterium]